MATAAAYLRVSSRAQGFPTQREAISRALAARGDDVPERWWYEEKRSGGAAERPELDKMLAAARLGFFTRLYVFRIDRLTRRGIRDTLAIVEELRGCGVELVSIADGFSLAGPAGDVVLAVMAWAAQMERQALGERISAARERVEAAGGRWGRPRGLDPATIEQARLLRPHGPHRGMSIRAIAEKLKVSPSALHRALSQKGHYAPPPKNERKPPLARRVP